VKAVRVHAPGGDEALRYEEIPDASPGPGQALVRVEASGVNFIDVYHRTGLYKVPLPVILGREGAGTVLEVAADVRDLAPGDRVAWAGGFGSYAEKAVVPAEQLVKLPEGVSTRQGAAAMLQGMTAHYLAVSTYPLQPGDTCLVHAGAGGVGLLLTQIAKMRGARVFTTVSTDEKAKLSREAGADVVIDYTTQDFEAEAKRETGGRGVQVVYDSVGKTTFDASVDCVKLRGSLVMFGQSSGPVPPFELMRLAKNGIFLTRPSLAHYTSTREELLWRASELFASITSGAVRVRIDRELPLRDAAEAHRLLESRATAGKLLLIP